ncbi:MAG: hypothetical protein EPO42_08515 [Gallionellaceae bacterium]|nr:MAG: hypothetical protein EPO42_08515 [Gallionellaceae bacterium]
MSLTCPSDNSLFKRLFLGMVIFLLGCKGAGSEWQKASVPLIKPGATVQIRVAHATNGRLARMSPEQLQIMLASAQRTVRKELGVHVVFTAVEEIELGRLFARIPSSVQNARIKSIYDFKSGNGDKHKLAQGIHTTLTERGTKLDDAFAFAAPYLPPAHPKDLREFSGLLANVMMERLEQWRHIPARDGAPVLDTSPYNEWIDWDTLGYGELPYDLVITNQLIASAEYVDVDVHSAIRGGLTVGTTTYSRSSPYGSYVFWSTFPFLDNSEHTRSLRGGEQYSAVEAAELSGAYLAHEIGHLLFQFGHPFGQKTCIMNPVSMLRFREWQRQIDSSACPMGSRPEMTIGAVPVYFNAGWLRMSREP